ncbi:AI-2E family transporter, partial [Cupriavidus plantarum]|uniref:AI-2E family transporter n=1 Tax=Cupriavidus plantarum TaxID=942865 RepID=UPI0038B30643
TPPTPPEIMPEPDTQPVSGVEMPPAEVVTPPVAVEDEASARYVRRASIALVILATLASLYALHVARTFLVPVVMSIVLAYLLDPLVAGLQRVRVPRSVGATFVLLAMCTLLSCLAYLLQGQIESIVDRLPEIARKLSRSLGALMSGDDSMIQKVRRAATVLSGTGQPAPARAPQVVVERSSDGLSNVLWLGSAGVFSMLAQMTAVLFLTWFLLLGGDMFKRKFVKMVGKTISQKKISVHMLAEINRSIQRYMLMLLVTNAALGFCTWLLLKWLGMDNAGTWAVAAAALHLVPYFGAVLIAICLGVAAFMQFGTLGIAAIAAGGSLLIATLIGSVVTTWMTGRMARMNAVAVFVALLLFTFLWGTWGMLLAIPLAVIAKVVADHVEGLELLAEFLGE